MTKEEKADGKYVRIETMLVVALIALVIGFFGGELIDLFESDPDVSVHTSAQPQQKFPGHGLSPEQANMVLALENDVSLNPENVEAWTRLGNFYYDTDQFEKAIRSYKKSLELNPDNADVWTDMGVMYRRNSQLVEAVAAFDKAIGVDPGHEVSRLNKAVVLMYDLNDREGAARALEELIKLNPHAVWPNGQPVKDVIQKLKEGMNR